MDARTWRIIIGAGALVVSGLLAITFYIIHRRRKKSAAAVVNANPPASAAPQQNQNCAFDCSAMQNQMAGVLAGSYPDNDTDPSAFNIVSTKNIADPNPAKPDSMTCDVTYTHAGAQKERRMSFAAASDGNCAYVQDGLSMPDGGDFCDDAKCLTQDSVKSADTDGTAAMQEWKSRHYAAPAEWKA